MKLDLSKLDIKRLKAYRKKLIRSIALFEICDVCGYMCEAQKALYSDNPNYLAYKEEYERVKTELGERQRKERLLREPPLDAKVPVIEKKIKERRVIWDQKKGRTVWYS